MLSCCFFCSLFCLIKACLSFYTFFISQVRTLPCCYLVLTLTFKGVKTTGVFLKSVCLVGQELSEWVLYKSTRLKVNLSSHWITGLHLNSFKHFLKLSCSLWWLNMQEACVFGCRSFTYLLMVWGALQGFSGVSMQGFKSILNVWKQSHPVAQVCLSPAVSI